MAIRIVAEDFEEKITEIRKLGEGFFGKVSLYQTPIGLAVIKKTKLVDDSLGYPPDLLNEIDMLIKFKSLPNIVQIRGAHLNLHNRSGYIILEPLDTSLDKWVKQTKFEDRIRFLPKLITEIGVTLAILHKFCLVHNDIKSNNILIKLEEGVPTFKLADFGKSKHIINKNSPYGGIFKYCPPHHHNIFHSEYWAFMICLLDAVLGLQKIKSTSSKVKSFWAKYLNKEDLDLETFLKHKLGLQKFNKIPESFWDFIKPVREGSMFIGAGLDAINYRFNMNTLSPVLETVSRIQKDHPLFDLIRSQFSLKFKGNSSGFAKFRFLLNKFLALTKLEEKNEIFQWAEVAYVIVVKWDAKKLKWFKNQEEFLAKQREFLEKVGYQTMIV